MTKKIDRWKAVRRGKVYCAPACGFGCTHAEYVSATRSAKRLCESLGKGWKPVVHENLGWFYRAQKGNCAVHEYVDGEGKAYRYRAFFNTAQQFLGTGKTAREAVEDAVIAANECCAVIIRDARKVGLQ